MQGGAGRDEPRHRETSPELRGRGRRADLITVLQPECSLTGQDGAVRQTNHLHEPLKQLHRRQVAAADEHGERRSSEVPPTP